MRHLFVGLAICALGIWGVVAWWKVFGLVMRGVIPFLCVVVGMAAILSGLRRMPDEDADTDADFWDDEEPVLSAD